MVSARDAADEEESRKTPLRRLRGKRNRVKGVQEERDVVNWWKERGFEGGRKRLVGGMDDGKWGDDVWLELPVIGNIKVECKLRVGNGFAAKTLVKWLSDNDFLSVRKHGDGQRFIFMRYEMMERILEAQRMQREEILRLTVLLAKEKTT